MPTAEETIADREADAFATIHVDVALLDRFPRIKAMIGCPTITWAKAVRLAQIVADARSRR